MSYALGATPLRANAIRIGERAKRDVILARASYEASSILLRSMTVPRDRRVSYIESQLRRYNAGTKRRFVPERARMIRSGVASRQATFDAMRLIIANHYAQLGVEAIQGALAHTQSAEALGDRDAEVVGCAITGGVTAIGALVATIYGGGAAGSGVGTGGQMVGQVLDCNKEQREAAMVLAEKQHQTALAQLALAELEADAEGGGGSGFFGPMSPTAKKALIGGGVVLALLVVGVVIMKV